MLAILDWLFGVTVGLMRGEDRYQQSRTIKANLDKYFAPKLSDHRIAVQAFEMVQVGPHLIDAFSKRVL